MKKMRILRLLGIALIASMLLSIIPASAVFAAKDIDLSDSSVEVGDTIEITGTDWPASTEESQKWADVYLSADNVAVGKYVSDDLERYYKTGAFIGYTGDDDAGEFTCTLTIPSVLDDGDINHTVGAGTYYIYVTYTTTLVEGNYIYTKNSISITGGEITISPVQGKVDSTLTIGGDNFAANTAISVKFDGATVPISSGSTMTNSSGDFTCTILVPDGISGAHNVSVTVGSTVKTTTFTIDPGLVIAPQAGKGGDTVSVSGTGFGRRSSVTMYFNSLPVTTNPTGIITDTNGSFSATFTVPANIMTAGVYQVEGDDGVNVATGSFTLNVQPTQTTTTTATTTTATTTTTTTTTPVNTAKINVNASGSFISIGGSGYKPSSEISIMLDGVKLDTVTSKADGTVIVNPFELPGLSGGEHEILVTDGTNSDTYTYTVESTPPAVPTTVAPAPGDKVKPATAFEWKAVSDITLPVTYQLQISTSQTFGAGAVILDIEDIEMPLYELTELQAANLVAQETPYYYRVRAIDGAKNEGTWTAPVGFYVSESAGFPMWAWYAIAGIGGVLLFGIGYLVGRRTAFYY